MSGNGNKSLPTLLNASDLIQTLKKWQTQLNPLLTTPRTPQAPWNFSATRARGGIQLQWAALSNLNADGYQILRSDNGDFSNPTIFSILGSQVASYFDSLPATAGATTTIQKWYHIRATNGTQANPQSVLGVLSGIVTTTSIDPTDTTTPATITYDQSTTDKTQTSAGRARIVPGNRIPPKSTL